MRTRYCGKRVKCLDMGEQECWCLSVAEQEPDKEGSLVGCFRGLWCPRNGALEAALGILPVGESKHRYLRGLLRKNCPWGASRRYSGFKNTEVESARVSGERCMCFRSCQRLRWQTGGPCFYGTALSPPCNATEASIDPEDWEYEA